MTGEVPGLAADRLSAAQVADTLDRLLSSQHYRFTPSERRALRLARASLDRFLQRTITEE